MIKRLAMLIIGAGLLWAGVAGMWAVHSSGASSAPVAQPAAAAMWHSAQLDTAIAAVAGTSGLGVSVSLADVSTGATYSYGSKAAFTAASTSKVLTAALVLKQAEAGILNLDQTVSGATVRWHVRQMINQSDNTSWVVLNSLVGGSQLESYARQLGLRSYDFESNQMSGPDEAKLLLLLAQGELLDAPEQELLLGYMQGTNNEELIPAALPEDVAVYHKYGLLDGNLHDAAILEHLGRRFVLVVYTNDPSGNLDYAERATLIRKLTVAVLSNL